jgi:hypothetical protein
MADRISGVRAIARPARDITSRFLLRPISIAAIERASAFDMWLRPKRQHVIAYKQHLEP